MLPEACYPVALDAGVQPFDGFPEFDQIHKSGNKIVYTRQAETVMVDRTRQKPIRLAQKCGDRFRGRYSVLGRQSDQSDEESILADVPQGSRHAPWRSGACSVFP
jgi:hypothetical protein